MIDVRIIEENEFMSNENFIKIEEFKSLFFKLKKNELSLEMKPGDSDEVVAELV